MSSLGEFLDMGGYGAFVWPAFGITALVMAGLLAVTVYQLRQRRRQLAELESLQETQKDAAP